MTYRRHQKENGWKDVSIATSYRAIRRFCNWLVEVGKVKEKNNPCLRIKEPTFKKKIIQPLTENEIRGLLLIIDHRSMSGHKETERKLCNLRDKAIIYIYTDTAIRLRELHEILLSDINLDAGTIKVSGKNGEERIVPFDRKAKASVSRYIIYRGELGFDDPYLWVNEYGRPLSRWGICSLFTRLKALAGYKSGVRVSSHTFRHTAAITALRNGMDGLILQRLLGHKTLHQTNEYTALISDDVIKAHHKYSPVQSMDI
jgi:integrase/recombinase XerD